MHELDAGRAALKRRAKFVGVMILAYLVLSALSLVFDLTVLSGSAGRDEEGTIALGISFIQLALLLTFLVSVVAVAMWIHRAHANLFDAGFDGLEYTPGWSIGWFFVPFANLIKPFQAMRELYNRSLGQDDSYNAANSSELTIWWGCYLGGSFAGNMAFRLDNGLLLSPTSASSILSIVSTLLLIVSAIYLKRIIGAVTSAQDAMMGVSETFA